MKIQFITDIEGHLHFFLEQIKESAILKFNNETKEIEFTDPDGVLVFGGDASDRGDDITIIEMLTNLKNKYPDQVHLIAGNRDINKLRFLTELPLDSNEQLHTQAQDVIKPPFARQSYQDFLGENKDTAIKRLQWILKATMGAPTAFEKRREELTHINKKSASNTDVYNSFRQSVEPGGFLWRYLNHTQLALVLGDTLFAHGSITKDNIKTVPTLGQANSPIESNYTKENNLRKWINQLNHWHTQSLQNTFEKSASEQERCDNFSSTVAGATLYEYAARAGSRHQDRSIMIGNMFGVKNKILAPINSEVATWLAQNNIKRVVLGHQPHGQTPGYVIGTENGITSKGADSIELVTGDTLYGNALAYDKEKGSAIRESDPRGPSIAKIYIIISEKDLHSHIFIEGKDGNGKAYQFDTRKNDPFIGRTIIKPDGSHALIRVNSNPQYGQYKISSKEPPYTMTYGELSTAKLHELEKSNSLLGNDQRPRPTGIQSFGQFTPSDGSDDDLSPEELQEIDEIVRTLPEFAELLDTKPQEGPSKKF